MKRKKVYKITSKNGGVFSWQLQFLDFVKYGNYIRKNPRHVELFTSDGVSYLTTNYEDYKQVLEKESESYTAREASKKETKHFYNKLKQYNQYKKAEKLMER